MPLSTMNREEPFVIFNDVHELTNKTKMNAMKRAAAQPLKEKFSDTKKDLDDLDSFVDQKQLEIGNLKDEIMALYDKMQKLKDDVKDARINLLTEENHHLNARLMQKQTCIPQTHIHAEKFENLKNDTASYFLHLGKLKDQVKECTEGSKVLASRTKSLLDLNNLCVKHECTEDSSNEAACFDVHLEKEEERNLKQQLSKSPAR